MTKIKSCPRCGLIIEGWSATDGFHPYSHDCELVENDAASEMNGIIREITMEVNGDDEPAFLDDAVRRSIENAVAAERREIADWLHTMSRRKHEEAENMTDYEEQLSLLGEMGAYFAACDWVKQRGPTKQPVRRKDNEDE